MLQINNSQVANMPMRLTEWPLRCAIHLVTSPTDRKSIWIAKSKCAIRACTRVFQEKANRVRNGIQLNYLNYNKLITLTKEIEDPFLRQAL